MTYATRPGDFGQGQAVGQGQVYAENGTLMLGAPSPYATQSSVYPSSFPAPRDSWTDERGSWVMAAPPSTSRSGAPRANDRALLGMMGVGSLAILAAFAAVLMAFSSEERVARPSASAAAVAAPPVAIAALAPAAPAVAPPTWAGGVIPTNVAPVVVAEAAPAALVAAPVAPAVVKTSPTPRAVVAAPVKVEAASAEPSKTEAKGSPRIVAVKLPGAAPAPVAAPKARVAAGGKTEREILEDLLEQQLAR